MENIINPKTMEVKTAGGVLNGALAFMALGLVFASAGAYLGMLISPYVPFVAMIIGALILKLILYFTVKKWSKIQGLNVLLFITFTMLSGLTLYPILMMSLASSAILDIAIQAFMASAGLFMVMGVLGWTTKKDLTSLGGILSAALIVIIIAGLINLFFFSSIVSFIISCVAVIIFAGFTAYDMQQIKNGGYENAIEAGINLYLDFINLFVNLFYILLSLAGFNE
ncbi:MAG: Bax inhibitor-1/YccA family protein [Candidatus Gracilibacteria bacterium]|nr:Bax inhibitor-1/YccA family protein [Candidatus Gracilibacteria bacterium]